MRRASVPQESFETKEIARLKEELYLVKSHIIRHVPDDFATLLDNFGDNVLERPEIWDQLDTTVDEIVKIVEAKPKFQKMFLECRIYCPLCGEGTHSVIQEGFKLPEGLRRHLLGAHGSHRCFVTECALSLAVERFDKKHIRERPNV